MLCNFYQQFVWMGFQGHTIISKTGVDLHENNKCKQFLLQKPQTMTEVAEESLK